ncbi:MAG: OmpA family protein [Microscillaceae bacterium]|jgi:outer membrane protein OmpA-like peptidoglycan-associated protein|nr:OmpA family protein [Microscillaceae bacterium]
MNPISFLLSLVLIVWIGVGSYIYTCVYWQLCDGWRTPTQTEVKSEPEKQPEVKTPDPAPDTAQKEPPVKLSEKEKEILTATHTVYFALGSTQLLASPETEKFFTILKEYLQKSPTSKIVITGHTDNVGSAENNLQYGKNRAEAVKAQLIARGLPTAQIITDSKGMTVPIADNESEAGRQKNRRAEIVFQQ